MEQVAEVVNETVVASTDWFGLDNGGLLEGSEKVYSTDWTRFYRGMDYEIRYAAGELTPVEDGRLDVGEEYNVDYQYITG